ncbi:thioesterase [Planosporangium flavigriseum]|uniref:Thioesterase n=1 Tax=Planosporangium flavigriseum TaxID=373681 RepID=A0A8J3PNG2_9ACTN|nr:alpha/beta fold hydrolase [Planosporangium flavigriseum]NJC67967.1 thioesterase [Planosporangium flavigriseum]GIG76576.1 thioesterase [Planosporangium flavigriseum]
MQGSAQVRAGRTPAAARWLGSNWQDAADGATIALFCFSHAGGGSAFFRPWRAALAPAVDVRPVLLPGREWRLDEVPYRRMEDLVEPLCVALEPHVDRPYALFGHSMGAVIAYEVARRFTGAARRAPICLLVSGRQGPRAASSRRLLWELPDNEFVAGVGRLGGTPPEVLEHPELLEMFLPALRADFELSENYQPLPGHRLTCPVVAYMGTEDAEVEHSGLLRWYEETDGEFALRVFAGDHFYLRGGRPDVLSAVRQDLLRAAALQAVQPAQR